MVNRHEQPLQICFSAISQTTFPLVNTSLAMKLVIGSLNNLDAMKRFIAFVFCLFTASGLVAQHVPVAIPDYAVADLGKLVTVNVTTNDYHPDGLSFKVSGASMSTSFTDSTITFSISYDRYFNIPDTIVFRYSLKDELGFTGDESIGKVYIVIDNNHYYDFLDLNNVRAQIQSIGLQFWPGPMATSTVLPPHVYEFPNGSGLNTIYNSSLWIGGLDETDSLSLAAERYRQNGSDFWPGPLSVNQSQLGIDTSTVVKWQKVWKLTREEVLFHKQHYREPGYVPIQNIASWPAHGDPLLNQAEYIAPFIDVDGDGQYRPEQGDYPLIRGDQCIFFVNNDFREHTETSAKPLGVEIHGMAYAFSAPEESPLENTIFFSYKIFNRSQVTYRETYVGLFTDFDIGNSKDDFVGCDVVRGAYYGYNGDSVDGLTGEEPGSYSQLIPAQGMVVLGGPAIDPNETDDQAGECNESVNGVGFGDGLIDNERFGMSKFVWFNNIQGVQGDPIEAEDYYNYMKGIWIDGTAMEYGGNGHISSGAYGPSASFMFPGLSDPCFWGTGGEEPFGMVNWTEVTAGNEPNDRRGLSAMGPFTFETGAMKRVDIAYVSAFPQGENSAVETLLGYVDDIKSRYIQDPTYFGYQWLGDDELSDQKNDLMTVYPNPAKNRLFVDYPVRSASYKLINITGKVEMSGLLEGEETHALDVSSLKPGLYFLMIYQKNSAVAAKVLINR
jgi:hypothetical protein